MDRVHIIGCGRFGQRALEFYRTENKSESLVLVDSEPDNLAASAAVMAGSGTQFITDSRDGVVYLCELLNDAKSYHDDWIIPTVPMHLAFAVLVRVTGRQRLAWENNPGLPNTFFGERDELCSSLADFLCPKACPQPRKYCYHTREKRNPSLFKLLAGMEYRIDGVRLPSIILASSQIAPGLGGFPLRRLSRLINFIQKKCSGPLLFSTACRCHGVTNILAGS